MSEKITLNRKEQTRAKVITMVLEGKCTARDAAELLGLSRRHLLRLKKGFREAGPEALAHGNRTQSDSRHPGD
jgi:CRP-like cAMP-binding protein